MRVFKLFLIMALVLLQYRLWVGHNGIKDYYKHREVVTRHIEINQKLVKRNQLLTADVHDLKNGLEAIEERARLELGMIKEGETFFRIIPAQQH
ncbi:MAG: cell division protein FtsB [Alteromonadaceae bacterium]|jgi:cell division protein FtsB